VFPSMTAKGRKPLYASSFVADYLHPAAKKAGVQIQDGQRSGLHNLRHSLSNWLVNKPKVEPKTVQGILRHSKIQRRSICIRRKTATRRGRRRANSSPP
jgi:integrase